MIKDRFLEPVINNKNKELEVLYNISKQTIIDFLKTGSDEEIRAIGKSLLFLYPDEIKSTIGNRRFEDKDYTFIDEFVETYKIPTTYTTQDKTRGGRLLIELGNNPNLTATEFLST